MSATRDVFDLSPDGPAPACLPAAEAGRWLDPSPFRAHVLLLMSTSGLTARELAALAGVSGRLVRRLVSGRDGRPLRRIDPQSAGRLLTVTSLDATLVRTRRVPTERVRAVLLILHSRGRSPASLGRLTGLSAEEIVELAAGRKPTCQHLVELRLIAALAESDARVASGIDAPFEAPPIALGQAA